MRHLSRLLLSCLRCLAALLELKSKLPPGHEMLAKPKKKKKQKAPAS